MISTVCKQEEVILEEEANELNEEGGLENFC